MRFQIDWADLIVGSKFDRFCFVLLCIWVQFSKYKLPGGGLIFGGAISRRVFCVTAVGGLYLGDLYMEGLIFGVLR